MDPVGVLGEWVRVAGTIMLDEATLTTPVLVVEVLFFDLRHIKVVLPGVHH